jgi:excisionase family DNA binding protein
MLTPPSSPYETYRRAELRLRMLLFGDEADTPGVIRGGEEVRLRVRSEIRRMRHAFDDLASAQEEASAAKLAAVDLAEELQRAASTRAQGPDPALLKPAEAASALGVSVSSIYRAVRSGELRAVRLPGRKRGGMRIPASEVDRLVQESTTL